MSLLTRGVRGLLKSFNVDVRRISKNRFAWAQELGILSVLDIGANIGHFALEIRSALPEARILSFEPLQEVYGRLERSLAGLPKVSSYRIALGDSNGPSRIRRPVEARGSEISSLLELSSAGKEAYCAPEFVEEEIAVRRLDDFLLEQKITLDPGVLVKLDVQGFEDRVISGGGRTLQAARAVIVELVFHEIYRGQKQFDEIYAMMRSLGFHYAGNVEGSYLLRRKGLEVEVDGVFVRP